MFKKDKENSPYKLTGIVYKGVIRSLITILWFYSPVYCIVPNNKTHV